MSSYIIRTGNPRHDPRSRAVSVFTSPGSVSVTMVRWR